MQKQVSNGLFKKLFLIVLCASIFSGNPLGVAAQTRRASNQKASSNQPGKSAPKCTGGWTGSITYTRTQTNTLNKTTPRVSARGEDTRNWEMKYDYNAQVTVLEVPEKNGSSIGRARIDNTMTSTDKVSAVEKNSCDRGKTWREMHGETFSKTVVSGSDTASANVNVGVNADGTYTVSVALPPIKGKLTGEERATYSGQCVPKEGKNLTMQPTDVGIEGNSLTSDGKDRVDPKEPNNLSGTYVHNFGGVVEKITWNLRRCGGPLQLIDLKFEDMKFPTWNAWQEIQEQRGTTDGNWVKLKARVLNTSGETKFADVYFMGTFKGDKWDGAQDDLPFSREKISVRLEPNEDREVEMLWDSSGWAWFDDGRPRLVQRIKAEVWENNKEPADQITKNLKIAPKPVVLVHGLWSDWAKAWKPWQNILTTSHSYDWKAFPVGEKPEKGKLNTGGEFLSTDPTNTIAQNAVQLAKYVRYAQEDRNAWHVDIVAHSMGGLISRYYIHHLMKEDKQEYRPTVTHLIMLGTPNMGSPCADLMDTAFFMTGRRVEAVRELRQNYVEGFNGIITNRKGVKFSALAGKALPTICYAPEWNDGVVTLSSAKWTVRDNAESKSLHTDLTGTKDFTDFVKPRLAIGPYGDHKPEMPQLPKGSGQQNGQNESGANFMNASYSQPRALTGIAGVDENAFKPDFAKAVKLAPKQSVEIDIPVQAANNFGLTFMADAQVSATLFNDKGVIVGKNLTETPEANSWFRSIFFDKPTTAGTWKLKLENTSDRELEAILATWKTAVR
ncbi:MAG TPA: hypothetical protein VK400_18880 [Pyrinomonadaceae bacterium]|nr:hypothetical protein [Pyrinomonadaceae bacterium]